MTWRRRGASVVLVVASSAACSSPPDCVWAGPRTYVGVAESALGGGEVARTPVVVSVDQPTKLSACSADNDIGAKLTLHIQGCALGGTYVTVDTSNASAVTSSAAVTSGQTCSLPVASGYVGATIASGELVQSVDGAKVDLQVATAGGAPVPWVFTGVANAHGG